MLPYMEVYVERSVVGGTKGGVESSSVEHGARQDCGLETPPCFERGHRFTLGEQLSLLTQSLRKRSPHRAASFTH